MLVETVMRLRGSPITTQLEWSADFPHAVRVAFCRDDATLRYSLDRATLHDVLQGTPTDVLPEAMIVPSVDDKNVRLVIRDPKRPSSSAELLGEVRVWRDFVTKTTGQVPIGEEVTFHEGDVMFLAANGMRG